VAAKRLHHYLPRFYLSGFTDPGTPHGHAPYVWVRDVATGGITKRAPKNVAAESGYYAVGPGMGPDALSLENELAAMESRAARALRGYLAAPPGARGAVPSDLATFIAWLGAKVPWLRRAAGERWARYLSDAAHGREEVPDDPGFRVSLVNARTGARRREPMEHALALIRSEGWVARADHALCIEVMRLQAWYFRTQLLPALHWALLTAPPGRCFVTSDRPLVWVIPYEGYADSPAALRQPSVEASVPLDATHALIGSGTQLPAGVGVRSDDVKERTARFAERMVISPTLEFVGQRTGRTT
jgi:hypothetical protein